MSEQTSAIISKVWGMCNPLRDDGVSYGDYLEQLTYLIFLKMSDEYSGPPYKRDTGIPAGFTWSDMCTLKGAELEDKYKKILEKLGEQSGILGKIFKGATNKISNAAILYRVVQMIDNEKWVAMSSDVKGEIYEGLLQKNAEDIKSGAGQYFTPRPLIKAMVECLRPEPMKTIADPCCGSGTIPIEAALIAKNRAPGLERSFAAQKWKTMPGTLWLDAAEEAMDKEFHGTYDIWGGDIDPAAVELAKHNAALAGVEDCIRFEVADAGQFHRDSEYGQLVTNPPYGERLLEKKEAEALYRVFGAAMAKMPPKWRILVLSSHTEFERTFGRTADKKRKLYNGMIKCELHMYFKNAPRKPRPQV